jgi:hypothetical protein
VHNIPPYTYVYLLVLTSYLFTQLVEKVHNTKYCVREKETTLPYPNFQSVTFPFTLQLFLVFFGTGLRYSVRRHTVLSGLGYLIIWCTVMNILEEHLGLHRPSNEGGIMSYLIIFHYIFI